MDAMSKLRRNPKEIYQQATKVLIKIAENIIGDPSNRKWRTLQKSNSTISTKLLGVFGGIDCLISMGFVESDTSFTLPQEASLDKLKEVLHEIREHRESCAERNGTVPRDNITNAGTRIEEPETEELIQKIELPPYQRKYQNEFLHNIGYRFHIAQIHDNKYLHARAQKLIPLAELELNAQKNLRKLQRQLKQGKLGDLEVSLQDMLILELLNWFKNDFFSWVDSPRCEYCKGATKFAHMSTDHDLLKYTDRVEMHRCNFCNTFTAFPRYNDLNILMETRRGRCGEWANCFTLFCRAMGWDARHVFDETDHVWTEVYSFREKRWLHCDPCENVCDAPLMYEAGWNKQISYVIAYSGEEVQDVTWRYSSNHREALGRRVKCTEDELLRALDALRTERQRSFSDCRRKYLASRSLSELCEFLMEKQATDKDKKGRDSGSLAWRIARGEQQLWTDFASYTWKFPAAFLEGGAVYFQYSAALDRYQLLSQNESYTVHDWHRGVSDVENIFRKVEQDWQMVYLARSESAPVGKIKWSFEITAPAKAFDTVDIVFEHALYEDAKIEITVTGNSQEIRFMPNQKSMKTEALSGSSKIEILATLSGGNGDVAWQHAQLFRQSSSSRDYCFKVTFTGKDV